MAALDRRLSAGEKWLNTVESTCKTACQIVNGFMRGFRGKKDEAKPAPPQGTGPAPAAV
jgi:hypothetical protein